MSEDANVQYLDQKPYAAKYDRQPFRDILTEGVITSGALEVTQLDTPAMGVKVAKGRALVQGDQSEWQGHYGIRNDASKNLSIAASDPANPRKDRIVAQVYDSIDIGGAQDKWALEVLTGTPAASPVVPDLPDDALDLAIVDVAASATTITNANITDQRSQIDLQNLAFGGLVTIATAQTITGQKTHTSPLFTGTLDGWIAAGETWTRTAATTFTISGDKTGKYQKGDKIKLTQNATVKYFYVIGVSYSDPNTTITVTGGTDYTLAAAAITSPFYSKMENPQGFPHWFNYTPTYSASGSMTYTSVTTETAKFRILGSSCHILLYATGTTGGTASDSLFASLPTNYIGHFGSGAMVRDTGNISGYIQPSGTNLVIFNKYDTSNFGLGANRRIFGSFTYSF